MAIKLFELGFVLKAIDHVSGVLKEVETRIEGLNSHVKNTARWREAGQNMAVIGAGAAAFGAGIGYGLIKTVQAASQVQDQLYRLRNTLPSGAEGVRALGQAQAAAAAYSLKHATSETDLLKAIYLGTSAGLKMKTSIVAAKDAAALATGVTGDLATIQRTLNLAYINFRNPALSAQENMQSLSDTMAKAAAFDYQDVNELREQLMIAGPTAVQTGTSFKDLVTVLADWTRAGLTGTMAGEALEESLHGVLNMNKTLGIAQKRNAEGGIDLVRSLGAIRKHYIDLYGSMAAIPIAVQQQIQKAFGIRGTRVLLLDDATMRKMRGELDHVTGATQQFQAQMEKAPSKQWAILVNNLRQMEIVIGNQLLPTLITVGQALRAVLGPLIAWMKEYPMIVKFVALFAGIAAVIALVAGAAAALAGGFLMLASFAPAIAALAAPVALIGAGIAATGAAILTLGPMISGFFTSTIPQAFEWGVNLLKTFARGIGSAAMWPVHAIENVVGKLRSYLPFSPAKLGPLRDLNRVRIVETIAETIRPAPVLTAIRRVAAATAIAAPMIVGAGAPAIAGAAMPASAAATVVVNYSPRITINAAGGDAAAMRRAVMDALEGDRHHLVEIINRELAVRRRTEF